jgi:hypothetical protein
MVHPLEAGESGRELAGNSLKKVVVVAILELANQLVRKGLT